jgi:hypothetical protein
MIEKELRFNMEVSYNKNKIGSCTYCIKEIKIGTPVVILKSFCRVVGEQWLCEECFKLMATRINDLNYGFFKWS